MTWNRLAFFVVDLRLPKYPAQIFETAGVHRVAFEIEEKIARISQWQLVETKPGLMRHKFADTQSRFGALLLQTCLLSQASQSIRCNAGDPHTVEFCEHGSSRDPGFNETPGLLLCDIGDATEVIRLFPSGLASRRPVALATITARLRHQAGRQVSRERLQPTSGPTDIVADLVQWKALDLVRRLELAGPKHERALIRRPALYGAEQVTVKGDLKDVFWPGRACKLGIPRLVGPSPAGTVVLNAYKEIGVAEPRTCRKGR